MSSGGGQRDSGSAARTPPMQCSAPVLDLRPAGAYLLLTLHAPEIARATRPGQFVALSVGGAASGTVLHRSFAVYRASPADGTISLIFSVSGPGTTWLAGRRTGDSLAVVGPLGRPFPLPVSPVAATLVGGGYGSAPLFALGEALRGLGSSVQVVLGAATADRLFGVDDALALSTEAAVTTEDGSAGTRGLVTDVLPEVLARSTSTVVYACGPMRMLAAAARIARAAGAQTFASVEEAMACGIGVCMTCVLPVVGDDGVTRMTRACVDGPVFDAAAVRWADLGTVPSDTYGADPRDVALPAATAVAASALAGNPRDSPQDNFAPHAARGTALDIGDAPRAVTRSTPPLVASDVDLTSQLGPLTLTNPVLTASGSASTGRELGPFFDLRALGAVVTASVTARPRAGSATPRMAETPSGMLSDVGLPGPGVADFVAYDLPRLVATGAKAIVSVAGGTPAEYFAVAAELAAAPGVVALELNLACPDAQTGHPWAASAQTTAAIVAGVRAEVGELPVLAKLTPEVADLPAIAGAAVEAGATGITLIAGLRAMSISPRTLRPMLSTGVGDLSGPAIRPVALRCVYDVRAALPDAPILAAGGIRCGLDALEFAAAGANAVQVGTALFGDPTAPARVVRELADELASRGFHRFADAVSTAHVPHPPRREALP